MHKKRFCVAGHFPNTHSCLLRHQSTPLTLAAMQHNLAPQEALALIHERLEQIALTSQPAETLPLAQTLGRVLAHDVAAPLDLPPFDNSAVDGYAVRAHDLLHASTSSPVDLSCQFTLAAAPLNHEEDLLSGHCARIMTGAPVPDGADAIVMREDVDESDPSRARILFAASTCEGQFIRRRGEDIRRGEIAVCAGTRLRASHIALLAACGFADVQVSPRPRVAIITTGDELVEPGQPLALGQIYNSNTHALDALCRECGAQVTFLRRVGDDPRALGDMMREAARQCDIILTSGGVSAGDFDPVRDVLLGTKDSPAIARAHFWKAKIKPGKPILFASIQHESRIVPIFALPGNPVSVAVTFEIFVRPALLFLQGDFSQRRTVRACVDCNGTSPPDKTEYVRALVTRDERSNTWLAQITGAQGSGRLTTMARANALLVIPAGVARYKTGDQFEARLLD